ncbi:MAG: CRTAC1 family protein [Phycisphaerales bacterium]|nr:CRTAC1 family protein [Phycisphaerales bacterium]
MTRRYRRALIGLCSAASAATAQPFTDQTTPLGLALDNGSACWGDINADGWPDLSNARAIWINHEGKTFERVEAPATGLIVDIDNDGDGDLISFAPIGVWRNVQAGSPHHNDAVTPGPIAFEPVPLPELPETSSRGAAVGDYNGDGLLDVYFGGFEVWEPQITYPDLLLLSDGKGGYALGMTFPDFRARGVTACDFDEDGDLDIYVSNYRLMPNVLWVNDGHGVFTNRAAELGALATSEGFEGGHSIGACWGDFDADGHIDLFAGNFAHVDSRGDQPKSRFLRSRGPGPAAAPDGATPPPFSFDDLHECGVWYQESYASPACADFDNDGDLDLFFTTVYADASFGRKNYPVLYRNDTDPGATTWTFTDATAGSGLEQLPPTYQASWADFDHDGDLDLVTAGRLYANGLPPGAHWLELRVVADPALVANHDAIGAQARVTLPNGRILTRQVEAGTGEGNANSPILHFGLGQANGPLDLEVRWPGTKRQVVSQVGVDQLVRLQPEP